MDKPIPDGELEESRRNTNAQSRLERIAARAHDLYEKRGRNDGQDLDDWLDAEREIDAAEKD